MKKKILILISFVIMITIITGCKKTMWELFREKLHDRFPDITPLVTPDLSYKPGSIVTLQDGIEIVKYPVDSLFPGTVMNIDSTPTENLITDISNMTIGFKGNFEKVKDNEQDTTIKASLELGFKFADSLKFMIKKASLVYIFPDLILEKFNPENNDWSEVRKLIVLNEIYEHDAFIIYKAFLVEGFTMQYYSDKEISVNDQTQIKLESAKISSNAQVSFIDEHSFSINTDKKFYGGYIPYEVDKDLLLQLINLTKEIKDKKQKYEYNSAAIFQLQNESADDVDGKKIKVDNSISIRMIKDEQIKLINEISLLSKEKINFIKGPRKLKNWIDSKTIFDSFN